MVQREIDRCVHDEALLQVTDLPISEIGYQVGYESAWRFSVQFKTRFGFSPMAVRGVLSQAVLSRSNSQTALENC